MKTVQDPGLGTSYKKAVRQLMNPDGSYNIKRIGAVTGYRDIYKYLIDLPSWKFALVLVIAFMVINLLFTAIYLLIGSHDIAGIPEDANPFAGTFYFSAQTLTTVGYGHLAPKGHLTSITAAIEAFCGLIGFAIATGVLYGRFSRPSAKIGFTDNVLMTKHKGKTAIMFKMVNKRNNVLLNTKVSVLISLNDKQSHEGNYLRNYYSLKLEVDSVRYFPLTWTIVHVIDEESPLYGLSTDDIRRRRAEILILLEAFDETFSQNVIQKHSYSSDRWLEGYRFRRNFAANDKGQIVLNIDELNEMEFLEEIDIQQEAAEEKLMV
jgi:inward rectifier potassium channel